MKYLLAVGALAAALGVVTVAQSAPACPTGQVHGYVTLENDPLFLVGTVPGQFTASPIFFAARYNCKGVVPQVKRVGLGLYDVLFPGLRIRAATVDAISDEGISSSFWPLGNGIVRVALRGPLGGADVATRRDVPFSLVVY